MAKRLHFWPVLRLLCALSALVDLAVPASLWACACGCGIFDVGTRSMLPTHPGGMVSLEYDYQNQDRNWSGHTADSADNNSDKKIITSFYALGAQYMFNSRWGVSSELPYWNRSFKTLNEDGNIGDFTHSGVGDVRLRAIYSGFSSNMSTGLTFGLKLPTGSNRYANFDPDVQIGSGSTDLLVGAYHMGEIPGGNFDWFVNAQGDVPVLHEAGYVPGSQFDGALGTYYDGWKLRSFKIAPLAQLIGSHRWSDHGAFAVVPGSGYSRLFVAPGVEFDMAHVRVYSDVGFPVYQYTNGDQLVSSVLVKLNVSYHF